MSNNINAEKIREPLFHVTKRASMPVWESLLIRVGSIVLALLISVTFITLSSSAGFFGVFKSMFNGTFGSSFNCWLLFRETALLLCVGLALAPAFKMKFWNLGGNGQILMGALATTACMYYLGGKLPDAVVWILMFVSSIVAASLWAAIPAIFKAYFKTNESLFTLMMNYIAAGLIDYFIAVWYPRGSGSMMPIFKANLPKVYNAYLLPIIVAVLLTALMFIYFKFSKHGYEISVVGGSENTAKYVGINVKAVVIRTMVLSGAICGIVGLLLSGSINFGVISQTTADNRGFTAIIVAWLAKFDPIIMVVTSFFITFVSKGMSQVRVDCGLTNNSITNVVIGIIYFFIIGCEFFISYKLKFRNKSKEKNL